MLFTDFKFQINEYLFDGRSEMSGVEVYAAENGNADLSAGKKESRCLKSLAR